MRNRRIVLLNIIILFFLSFLTGIFIYSTNVFIYKKLLTVKNELISMAEDVTDCKIKYTSIRPYINSIIIQQVSLINKENHNVIQLGTVKIDYSIFSWLKNTP